jgi:hypothetical protein
MSSDSNLIAVRRNCGSARFAFTSRLGGVSEGPFDSLNMGLHVGDDDADVETNRQLALDALGIGHRLPLEAQQIHGANVAAISHCDLTTNHGRYVAPSSDALVTPIRGSVALVLFFADCVPVFLATGGGDLIGLAHAGWRGTAAGIAGQAVLRMTEGTLCPAPRGPLHAVIGPSVGICCYEVGEEVAEAALTTIPESARAGFVRDGSKAGKYHVDLAGISGRQLRDAGVPASNIEIIRRCACCENDTFFSVRGDGAGTGRCAAIAWLD